MIKIINIWWISLLWLITTQHSPTNSQMGDHTALVALAMPTQIPTNLTSYSYS